MPECPRFELTVLRSTPPAKASEAAVPAQRHYADHRPYPEPPARLADLTGATAGVVELPITIDWGPKRRYDLGGDADRRVVYEVVLQEAASTEDGRPVCER